MRASRRPSQPSIIFRAAAPEDLDTLIGIESRSFAGDLISRRSMRRLLSAPNAAAIVVEAGGAIAGYALLLFRADSTAARLYSLAVDPAARGRGIGSALIAAAEQAAQERGCASIRLE